MQIQVGASGAEHANAANKSERGQGTTRQTHSAASIKQGYAVDISGKIRDNDAYREHGRCVEDIMQQAQSEDVAVQKNYMAVMSHSMSVKDYVQLMEDGYHAENMDPEQFVSIVDRIKAELAKAGVCVEGYNDDLDAETLEQITGSQVMAQELVAAFAQADIPLTKENVEQTVNAYAKLADIQEITPGLTRYLLTNEISLTADGIYQAKYAVAAGTLPDMDGGYYQEDVHGYYGHKANASNDDRLIKQLDEVILQAGYPRTEEMRADAMWMISQSIPLTVDSFSALQTIRQISFPVSMEDFVKTSAAAIAQGKEPAQAALGQSQTVYEEAVALYEKVQEISEEAADLAATKEGELTLGKMFEAEKQLETEDIPEAIQNIEARARLEEIRLQMTVEVNVRLLKSGFAIDTAPMEELIDRCRKEVEHLREILYGESGEIGGLEQTQTTIQNLMDAPIMLLGHYHIQDATFTLAHMRERGGELKLALEEAGERYETLMTAPRRDLGDSIQKAFGNVDTLLEELQLPITKDNQRAVRILGYNHMELTLSNIEEVKAVDISVSEVIRKLTPAATLQMIRDGKNPLEMNVEELNTYLDGQQDVEETAQRYSRFLYKLEQRGDISEAEKESYLGVFRFIRQLEKNEGAALGAVLSVGAELSFRNILTAMRTSDSVYKRGGIQADIDDFFGSVVESMRVSESISEQIAAAFAENKTLEADARLIYTKHLVNRLAAEVSPEKLAQTDYATMENLELFEDAVQNASEDEALTQAYDTARYEELVKFEERLEGHAEEIWTGLVNRQMEATATAMEAAYLWKKNPAKSIQELLKLGAESDIVYDKLNATVSSFEEETRAQEAIDNYADMAQDVIENAMDAGGSDELDVQMLRLMHKQFSMIKKLSRQSTYELPMEIDGKYTSVRVQFIQDEENAGGLKISCDTELYGHLEADVQAGEGYVDGFFTTDRADAYEQVRLLAEKLKENLMKLSYGEIRISTVQADRRSFAENQNGNMTHVSDTRMFRLAREILTAL